jgi:hypothetical protein
MVRQLKYAPTKRVVARECCDSPLPRSGLKLRNVANELRRDAPNRLFGRDAVHLHMSRAHQSAARRADVANQHALQCGSSVRLAVNADCASQPAASPNRGSCEDAAEGVNLLAG